MASYIFRSLNHGPHLEGQLAVSVRAALQEIHCQGAFRYEANDAAETAGVGGGYVLMGIEGAVGWHHHQQSVFSRHGITCAHFRDGMSAETG